MVAALWPETYSYTLSIALLAGLPVVAFDIGAIARRIREIRPNAGHGLLPLGIAQHPNLINDRFVEFRSCHIVINPDKQEMSLALNSLNRLAITADRE